ncbi:Gag-Pro-Pol polyprotein [Turdus rufiventris]|nr:Gag-Pro-Pol polyprotein [Turdus rufiventris]
MTIDKFLKYQILEECELEYNTPIFPVKKPNGEYRLLLDLRAINEITKDIYPVVSNPYTLLTSIKERYKWFTIIDLKDAFFCIPIDKESRKLFAFEWENPGNGRKTQLTWTRLPQGFKNSPTLFGNRLAKELEIWTKEGQVPRDRYRLLQYVDDILIATEEKATCIKATKNGNVCDVCLPHFTAAKALGVNPHTQRWYGLELAVWTDGRNGLSLTLCYLELTDQIWPILMVLLVVQLSLLEDVREV